MPSTTVVIGKAWCSHPERNTISITHWILQPNSNSADLYPHLNPTCLSCQGCSLNSKKVTDSCTFEILATLSTKFLGWKTYTDSLNKFKLNSNYLDLLYSIVLRNPSIIPPLPTLQITSSSITTIFNSNEATQQLEAIYQTNYNQRQFVFYTDRSVIDICTNQCSMGIGWVQACNNQISHKFSAQIQLWPSSYKAKLISILSAISTCPRNSQIQIYTDSLFVILKYNKLKLNANYLDLLYSIAFCNSFIISLLLTL